MTNKSSTMHFAISAWVVLILILLMPFAANEALAKAPAQNQTTKEFTVLVGHKATVLAPNEKKNATLKSSNKKIATVTKDKKAFAKKVGTVTLRSKNKVTGEIRTYKIHCVKKVKKVTLKTKNLSGWAGESARIKYSTKPSSKAEKLKWRSSNPRIATVNDNGTVSFKAKGTVQITAYAKNSKVKKAVKATSLGTFSLQGSSISLERGKTIALKTNGPTANKKIKWSSNNKKAATVSSNGTVKAVSPGYADITATISSRVKATCKITVSENRGLLNQSAIERHGIGSCNKLAIVAHPDDETLWGGASLMSGDWFVVCLTNGDTPVRANEFRNVLAASNNKGVILNYPDDSYKHQRDEWKTCEKGIMNDLSLVINDHNWDQIVTYNPDGVTGHIHHKLTQKLVEKVCSTSNASLEKLYYYGVFYRPDDVPADLQKLTDEQIRFKTQLIGIYKNESQAVDAFWRQMLPYENWIKATEWKAGDKKPSYDVSILSWEEC